MSRLSIFFGVEHEGHTRLNMLSDGIDLLSLGIGKGKGFHGADALYGVVWVGVVHLFGGLVFKA